MNLPGQLALTTLGDLLGQLHRASLSGILELVESSGAAAGRAHRIFLKDGLVDAVQTGLPAPRLGELLWGGGLLSREGLSRLAGALLVEPRRRAGDILIDSRLATPKTVAHGLHEQLRLRLNAVFRVSEARVRFHVRVTEPEPALPSALSASEFLHDRPRARQRAAAPRATSSDAEHYRVLGVPRGSDAATVQRAFRRLALEAHPDRHMSASAGDRARALRRFAELSAAYHAIIKRC